MTYKITENLLTPNEYSRCQEKLSSVKGLVIHWTANPNTDGLANRNYFESLKLGNKGYASAHYFVCLNGDVIRCLPDSEMGYHVGASSYKQEALNRLSSYPNDCTVGVELCVIDWDGKMTNDTYNTAIEFSADKLIEFGLTEKDLWLHYDITGKDCHKWFVNNPQEWEFFKFQVGQKINEKLGKGAKVMNLNDNQWHMLTNSLAGFYDKTVSGEFGHGNDILSNYDWVTKSYNHQLTTDEVSWLTIIMLARLNKINTDKDVF